MNAQLIDGRSSDDNLTKKMDKPNICCIDVGFQTTHELHKAGYTYTHGSLGSKIGIGDERMPGTFQLLPDHNFPPTLHEADIIIIDMSNPPTKQFNSEEHRVKNSSGLSSLVVTCQYPQTLFDARPMGSYYLKEILKSMITKRVVIIVFAEQDYFVEYSISRIKPGGSREIYDSQTHSIYSFAEMPKARTRTGTEMTVVENQPESSILNKYLEGSAYHQTFHQPDAWYSTEELENDPYRVLIKNSHGEVVSFLQTQGNQHILLLPQLQNKSGFLIDFLQQTGPTLWPVLFPHSKTSSWKSEKEYWLPNHEQLISERQGLEEMFRKKLNELDSQIQHNSKKYEFLHEILSETGQNLTRALVRYFQWLEFDTVIDMDIEKKSGILEEDIQIVLPNGLLVVECKGIGGTSTDGDCSQVGKIVSRRAKQRNKFDVYGLYIVNHQRHIPPLKRQHPPFSKNQILDATNEERGLISTWQLYLAYYDLENEVLTKEDIKRSLLGYGLIQFTPNKVILLGNPKELFQNGNVCIIDLTDQEISIGEILFIQKDGRWLRCTVESIKNNDISVSKASKGEFGLKLSHKINKKTKLWKIVV